MQHVRVDTHIHVVPPSFAAAMAAAGGDASGWPVPDWTPDGCARFCDAVGIGFAVLSVTSPGPGVAGAGAGGRTLARACNDEVAAVVAESGGRFGFFASLPEWTDVEGTLAELDYIYTEQCVANGVVVMTSYGGRLLGDPAFAPIWQRLDEVGALVFIHPGCTAAAAVGPLAPSGAPEAAPHAATTSQLDPLPRIAGGLQVPILDYPLATTRTAVDLVLSGTLARAPRVDVILSHAGGTLPFIAARAFGSVAVPMVAAVCGVKSVDEAMRDAARFYYDVALSTSRAQLAALTAAVSRPDRILFGSDYPYAPVPLIQAGVQDLDAYAAAGGDSGAVLTPSALGANGAALLSRHALDRSNLPPAAPVAAKVA